jgi:hypothetical protein
LEEIQAHADLLRRKRVSTNAISEILTKEILFGFWSGPDSPRVVLREIMNGRVGLLRQFMGNLALSEMGFHENEMHEIMGVWLRGYGHRLVELVLADGTTRTVSGAFSEWAAVPFVRVCCNAFIEVVMRKVLERRGNETKGDLVAGICEFEKALSKFGRVHESLEGKDWFE